MKLLEKNWDAPGGVAFVATDYPDAPIADFVNWLRTTSAWHEDVELVHRRARLLDRALAEIRNSRPAPTPPLDTHTKKVAALAKARAAKRQRRLAAAGG